MATWRGIEYTEYVGETGLGASPQGEFAVDGSQTNKVYDIAWVDLSRAAKEFLGYSEVKSGVVNRYISRVTPHFHADFLRQNDSKHYQFAQRMAYQGAGVDRALPEGEPRMKSPRDTARYDKARLRLRYETLSYEVLDDDEMKAAGYVDFAGNPDESTLKRFVTIFPRPKGKFLGLVGNVFRYAGSAPPPPIGAQGPPLPQPPGRIIPSWDIRIIWHQVPEKGIPSVVVNPDLQLVAQPGAIDTTVGKVNLNTFLGMAAGSVLCLPPEFIPRRSPRGDRIYDVHFYFEFFPFLHNRVPRVLGGTYFWWRCSADGYDHGDVSTTDGKLIYDSAEFKDMFRAP